SGARLPVTRLTNVVLPAPFGPINATLSPGASDSETLLVTARPPKFFCRLPTLNSELIGVLPSGDRADARRCHTIPSAQRVRQRSAARRPWSASGTGWRQTRYPQTT